MADIQNNPGALIPVPSGRFLAGREFWANFSRNRGAVVAGAIVLILVFIAIFAPLIAPHSPIEQYRGDPGLTSDVKQPRIQGGACCFVEMHAGGMR